MKKESQNLASALLAASKTSSVEQFAIQRSTDIVIVVARRVKNSEAQTIVEDINKRADGQEISFLPAGGCPCCGK